VSPLTQGLRYRAACDVFAAYSKKKCNRACVEKLISWKISRNNVILCCTTPLNWTSNELWSQRLRTRRPCQSRANCSLHQNDATHLSFDQVRCTAASNNQSCYCNDVIYSNQKHIAEIVVYANTLSPRIAVKHQFTDRVLSNIIIAYCLSSR